MVVVEKMNAMGLKALHGRVQAHRPSVWLETVYRWRRSLNTGRSVPDDVKTLLIEATRGTDQEIAWTDFQPAQSEAA